MNSRPTYPLYVMCINNTGNPASLDLGRVYKVLRPRAATPEGHYRVIDNEGEAYLYPKSHFVVVDLPSRGKKTISELSVASAG